VGLRAYTRYSSGRIRHWRSLLYMTAIAATSIAGLGALWSGALEYGLLRKSSSPPISVRPLVAASPGSLLNLTLAARRVLGSADVTILRRLIFFSSTRNCRGRKHRPDRLHFDVLLPTGYATIVHFSFPVSAEWFSRPGLRRFWRCLAPRCFWIARSSASGFCLTFGFSPVHGAQSFRRGLFQ